MITKLTGFVAAMLLATALADAQQAGKVPRIGVLVATSMFENVDAFRSTFRALGYEEGKNATVHIRSGPYDKLDGLAAELVRLNVDVILADSAPATRAAKNATSTIPIVFGATADPIGAGFVKSLAHPGGNITGFSEITAELTGKRLQILKEIVPALREVAVLGNPDHAFHRSMVQGTEAAARQLGIRTVLFEARTRADIERAFATVKRDGIQAVFMLPHPLFATERKLLAALAIQDRLPLAVTSVVFVEAGGLFTYAPDYKEQFRRAATYVDKILKGSKVGELPVEQPTKFELIVNAKTAKALGLTIPRSLLLRADRIIK